MSKQGDLLNKAAREKGIDVSGPAPALPGLENEAARPDLPHVKLPRGGGRLAEAFAREVGQVIGANGLYRRETTPVTIDPESGRIEDMDAQRLRTYVDRQAVCYEEQYTRKSGVTIIPETMSVDEARCCLASDSFRYPLRRLLRVNFVRLPVMRADGRIELLPKGYDAESNIVTMKDCLEYPTDWDLERATLFLRDFFSEFPFLNERSLAVHILAMCAVYGASLLPAGAKRLNFAYRANRPRAGKGLLAQSAIVGPCGPFVQIQAMSDSKEEFKKILDTEALNGSPYIFFDEVENKLRNRTLNAFITATVWTGRLMNSQKKFAVPQSAIVFIAGNNIDLTGDLAGRFLLIDLNVSEADAQARPIEKVMDEVHLARPEVRSDLLAAMWALVRSWNEAKPARPAPSAVYRGFETFSGIYGGVVEYAGFANPLESTAADVDPDFADMQSVIARLAEGVDGHAEYEFNEIIEVCRALNAFEWHLEGKMIKTKTKVKDAEFGDHEEERERFELLPGKKSWFGKLFSDQYGGTKFTLPDGRRVQFGKQGKNRQRRYTIAIV